MNTFFNKAARLGTVLKGVAAFSVAAFGLALAPQASAQSGTVTLSNCSSGSTMTGFTWNGSTLTVTCSSSGGGTTPPPGGTTPTIDPLAGTFALVQCGGNWTPFAGAQSANGGATFTACIIRNQGWEGDYDVAWGASGGPGATPASGTIRFGNHDGSPKSFQFAVGSTSGAVTLSLTGVTPVSNPALTTTVNGAVTINVTGTTQNNPPPVTGGAWQTDAATPQVACNQGATKYGDWFTYNSQKQILTLQPGETAAVPFIANPGLNPQVTTSETTATPLSTDNEISISQCPGDFSQTAPCRMGYTATGGAVNMVTYAVPSYMASAYCQVVPGNKYYMNVRQVFRGTTANSCPSGVSSPFTGQPGCDVKVQVQNLK